MKPQRLLGLINPLAYLNTLHDYHEKTNVNILDMPVDTCRRSVYKYRYLSGESV